jgi:Family of unknown function (DUF6084)
MSTLEFTATGIEVEPYAAIPTLALRVHISSVTPVHAMALRCQVRIDPQRRGYAEADTGPLLDLFGDRRRWSETLRPFLWTHTSAMVPGFADDTDITLPLVLTYDLEVAAGKYLHAVRDGEIPLSLMFSGTVFSHGDNGFQVQQIPWDTDIGYRMPASVWRSAMDLYFPGGGWIRLPQHTLDALLAVRSALGLTTWEETFATLLDKAGFTGPDEVNPP